MANDLTTTDRADQSKHVAALANSSGWTMAEALILAEGLDVSATIASYERGLLPLKEHERAGLGPRGKPGALTVGLADDLAMLSTKISPTISTDQAEAWIKVMGIALSDLPGRVAREAAQASLHRPMQFMNEIETVVREFAQSIMRRHMLALRRLRDLDHALRTGPAVEDRTISPALVPIDPARLPHHIVKLGLDLGYLVQDETGVREATA